MGIKLSDYINDENEKLTPEEVRQFLIDYGFDEALEIREEPTSMSVADMQPMTELQLTKDSSVQGVPLTNEAYEKAIKEGE